jgi:7-cyano-7-deazaguanine synthase
MNRAILLSGGIDSIALAYWKKPEFAITINYGQTPAHSELRASKTICDILNIKHIELDIDCSTLGSGDLINSSPLKIAPSTEWWPYRNQLLVTLAAMKAVSYGIKELMVGSVLSDGFHKDGTIGFYSLINMLMNYQEGNLKISAPAISLTSTELVLMSKVPSNLLFYAHSCHTNNVPCGHCRGCNKYIQVIQNLHDNNWEKP